MILRPIVLGAAFAAVASYAQSSGSINGSVTGRLEYFQSRTPLAARASVKPTLDSILSRFRLHIEGLVEADALQKIPYADSHRGRVLVQEVYLESELSPFTLRIGLQAVRWSESWSLPSLDIWTARRRDRYFFDPVADQLKHPVGVLLRYAGQGIEVEGFGSARTPNDSMPNGIGELPERWQTEAGVRAKFRVQGFDFTPVYSFARQKHNYGFSLSYALDSLVPKIEVGSSNDGAFFTVAGLDIFLEDWSILPQVTFYQPLLKASTKRIFYLPIRYTSGVNKFDFQLLSTDDGEMFWGTEFTRSVNDTVTVSTFLQDYLGKGGGLGWVLGLRLSASR